MKSRHLGAYARAPDYNGICNGSSKLYIETVLRTLLQLLYIV